MPRPHTATEWWGELINTKAGGRADSLAKLLDVSDRTLRRWRTGEDKPRWHRIVTIRRLAGKALLNRHDTPEWMNAQADSD